MKTPAYLVKRQRIERLLRKRPDLSDREIARTLKTTHPTVAKVRRSIGLYDPQAKRLCRDGIKRRAERFSLYQWEPSQSTPYDKWKEFCDMNLEDLAALETQWTTLSRAERSNIREVLRYLHDELGKSLKRLLP